MSAHPDLPAEQAYIDHAYRCLDEAREAAMRLRNLTTARRSGTPSARYETDVIEDTIRARLAQLHLGDEALCFGRIDRPTEGGEERFYIGRMGVADRHQEPVVVDWRAPVAEPFYRATGRRPMGLIRRRHFATEGRRLLGIEDEFFGEGDDSAVAGQGALIAALEQSRTGYLRDIVATIQGEQDEIIRSELGGVMVVQGGPGTGKTVVALHRAAYLLYTHRFPLEDQGVLLVGPNRIFLRYIERVLPSLGEAGVELVVLADLVPETISDARDRGLAAWIKGDLRMAKVVAKAVRDRQRRLREDLVVGMGLQTLRLTVEQSDQIVRSARRRARRHNAGRRFVEQDVWEALAASARTPVEPDAVRDLLRRHDSVRAALEWMWPVLTPADLLRDLFGSRALIRLAADGVLDDDEQASLWRERGRLVGDVAWTADDVPLLDEARTVLGPRKRGADDEEIRTYGHIAVDEAQDLSPMQLRMVARRSLGGSMTVVGDIAQATGPWAPDSWDDVLEHLPKPPRKPPRIHELTIGYRIPGQIMELAARLLSVAAPELHPPRSVREGDAPPAFHAVEAQDRPARVAQAVADEIAAVADGSVAVICPDSLVEELSDGLTAAGIEHGRATRTGLDSQITLVPVRLVKGLELDAVVVVEPARIVTEEPQGLRALYVAITRPTKRLAVVHADPLPRPLQPLARVPAGGQATS
jgi:DNA helicase IV